MIHFCQPTSFLKGSTAFGNSTIIWGPSVPEHESVGDIPHSNYNIFFDPINLWPSRYKNASTSNPNTSVSSRHKATYLVMGFRKINSEPQSVTYFKCAVPYRIPLQKRWVWTEQGRIGRKRDQNPAGKITNATPLSGIWSPLMASVRLQQTCIILLAPLCHLKYTWPP